MRDFVACADRVTRSYAGTTCIVATLLSVAACCVLVSATAKAQPGLSIDTDPERSPGEFIVLGTASGPVSEAERAQPANALIVDGQLYLVDAGDGAVAQLARAGFRLPAVRAVFLSHLHFDHTAGMLGVIGLRAQLETRGTLRVYGPVGTQEFIDGLIAASAPAMRAGYGIPGERWSTDIEVVELEDENSLQVDAFRVSVIENSHFSVPEGTSAVPEGSSLSYRFDLPGRSIVYTGDTGPSEALVRLAARADLLVSEMIDVDTVLAFMRPQAPAPSAERTPTGFAWHMHAHHMTPLQVGELAADAQVKRLIITHYAPNPQRPEQMQSYLDAIRQSFSGEVELARDLQGY